MYFIALQDSNAAYKIVDTKGTSRGKLIMKYKNEFGTLLTVIKERKESRLNLHQSNYNIQKKKLRIYL